MPKNAIVNILISVLLKHGDTILQVAEKTALLRPIELKLVPEALEGSAFRSKFVDMDELMSYCSWFAVRTVAPIIMIAS